MSLNSENSTRAEREWHRRHLDIIAAATDLFMTHGFSGSTMQMIAESAEYSVGYLYKHFPSKNELLDAVIHAQLDIYSQVRNRFRNDPTLGPLVALQQETVLLTDHLADNPGLVGLLQVRTSSFAENWKSIFEQFRNQDIALFQKAQNGGEIRGGDPALQAATFNGVVWGLIQLFYQSNRPDRFGEIQNIVDELVLKPLTAVGPNSN